MRLHNNSNGTFSNTAGDVGIINPRNPFPTWFWDYDNDGALDLDVSASSGSIGVLALNPFGIDTSPGVESLRDLQKSVDVEVMHLYRNDGSGHFREVAAEVGLTYPALPMGANFGDLNNESTPYYEQVTALTGVVHPVFWPEGYGTDFGEYTRTSQRAMYEEYFVVNNTTLVFVGGVSLEEMIPRVEHYFGWMERAPEPTRTPAIEPPPGSERRLVYRNDEITLDQIEDLKPKKILVSPGPCSPMEAGISCDVIKTFAGKLPIFGVCLGHQSIGHVYGGKVVRAERLMHGKTSPIKHGGANVFKDMPNLYSSFMIDLRDIKTETKIALDKASISKLFKNHLNVDTDSERQLKQSIYPSINTQYKQGI